MTMTKQDFLVVSGLEVQTLELWLAHEWLVPEETSSGPAYSEIDLARAHLIQDLKSDLGVNDEGIDIVLHLVDQLHGMRRLLAALHDDLKEKKD
jgi:chaperone modulatory protein CbpM